MREYLNALVCVVLFGGLVRMVAPEGALQKYLRLTVALCLVSAITQPLLGSLLQEGGFSFSELLFSSESETVNYDEIYNQSLQNGSKAQAIEIIKAKIYQELSLSEETAEVGASFLSENGILTLEEVQVTLEGKGVLCDPRDIVSLVNSEWGCPCVVLYE